MRFKAHERSLNIQVSKILTVYIPAKHTDVVQGVEHTEDVQTVLNCLLGEVVDRVVPAVTLVLSTSIIA